MTWRSSVVPVVLMLSALGAWHAPADAAGPWRGQVVDAETGQPLDGVVVLAVWEKRSPGIIHDRVEFHDVDEVVTDADGRFILPARDLTTLNPFVEIARPKLTMFKGGYGLWRFRGATEWRKLEIDERNARHADAWRRLEADGAAFELPPLKTRNERLDFHVSPPAMVPNSRIPQFRDALRQERVFLGLQP